MSENDVARTAEQVTEDEGKPTIWLSFCPDYGIYHMRREVDGEDPSDTKFTRGELVDMVEGLMRTSQLSQANELVMFCAWARQFAHKVVMFTTKGFFRVYNPAPPDESLGEGEEHEEMKNIYEEWRKQHPDDAVLPTVPPSPERK